MRATAIPGRPDVPSRVDVPRRPDDGRPVPRRGALVLAVAFAVMAAAMVVVAVAVDDATGPHAFMAMNGDGGPMRWDPCEPIHYEVNYADAPPGASADVREAIARVAGATGIEFVDDGVTERTASAALAMGFEGFDHLPLPVLISWEPPDRFRVWAPPERAAGYGLPWRGGGDRYVSGVIVVLADGSVPAGFGGRFALGPLLMHEWGHILGLGHVVAGDELMWSPQLGDAEFPDWEQTDWGPGDRDGLAAVGRPAGCLSAVGG